MAQIVTIDGIPVYRALVQSDGDTGMLRISLVDDPAVQVDFLAFKNQEARKVLTYAVQDEDKHLVLGVVMRADYPIYRRDADGFEYYIIYKPDTIRTMAEKYLAENRQNLVNLMHEDGTEQEGIQMVQYFIVDREKGVAPAAFDVADGSLLAEFHVTNEDVWAAIKDGTYKGFSLEGIFDLAPEHDAADVQRIVDSVAGQFRTILKNHNHMAKLKGILGRIARAIVALGNISTDKGILSWDGEDDLKAGDSVFVEDAEGNRTAAADGDYVTEDGKTIVVVDGKVSEIKDAAAEVAPEAPAEESAEQADEEPAEQEPDGQGVNTDKGTLYWMGDEDLKEGDDVFVDTPEGEEGLVAAPDGDYTTKDGKVIAVVDGKVASITDPAAEVAEQQATELAAVKAENESLSAEVKALREEIAALKAAPAAKPAHEEFTGAGEEIHTGNKGIDRLAKIARAGK